MQPNTFSKMHGLGNDFVVINALEYPFQWKTTDIIRLADRHSGIGFDQLLIIEPAQENCSDFAYRIFNADGSEVEHCGNGARCFAKYIRDHKLFNQKRPLTVSTKKGIIHIHFVKTYHNVDYFCVEMGEPDFSFMSPYQKDALAQPIQLTEQLLHAGIVSIGNPHAVIDVDDVATAQVDNIGYILQTNPLFPQQINVGFMQIKSPVHIALRVFERGVGETQACGTGACAAVAVGIAQGKLKPYVTVSLTRGELTIEWQGAGNPLYMTGPAEHVYDGVITC